MTPAIRQQLLAAIGEPGAQQAEIALAYIREKAFAATERMSAYIRGALVPLEPGDVIVTGKELAQAAGCGEGMADLLLRFLLACGALELARPRRAGHPTIVRLP